MKILFASFQMKFRYQLKKILSPVLKKDRRLCENDSGHPVERNSWNGKGNQRNRKLK